MSEKNKTIQDALAEVQRKVNEQAELINEVEPRARYNPATRKYEPAPPKQLKPDTSVGKEKLTPEPSTTPKSSTSSTTPKTSVPSVGKTSAAGLGKIGTIGALGGSSALGGAAIGGMASGALGTLATQTQTGRDVGKWIGQNVPGAKTAADVMRRAGEAIGVREPSVTSNTAAPTAPKPTETAKPPALKPTELPKIDVAGKKPTETAKPSTFSQAFKAAREKATTAGSPSTGQFEFGGKKFQTNIAGEKYVPMSQQSKVDVGTKTPSGPPASAAPVPPSSTAPTQKTGETAGLPPKRPTDLPTSTEYESGKKKKMSEETNSLIAAFLRLQETQAGNMFEAAKKAKKDWDKDGKIESEKDEVWGSRFKAAKEAGKLKEETLDELYGKGKLKDIIAARQSKEDQAEKDYNAAERKMMDARSETGKAEKVKEKLRLRNISKPGDPHYNWAHSKKKLREDEQIDEISKAAFEQGLKKYGKGPEAHKANAETVPFEDSHKRSHEKSSEHVHRLAVKAMEKQKVKEEVEEIDEVSRETKASYIDKAKEGIVKKAIPQEKVDKHINRITKIKDQDPWVDTPWAKSHPPVKESEQVDEEGFLRKTFDSMNPFKKAADAMGADKPAESKPDMRIMTPAKAAEKKPKEGSANSPFPNEEVTFSQAEIDHLNRFFNEASVAPNRPEVARGADSTSEKMSQNDVTGTSTESGKKKVKEDVNELWEPVTGNAPKGSSDRKRKAVQMSLGRKNKDNPDWNERINPQVAALRLGRKLQQQGVKEETLEELYGKGSLEKIKQANVEKSAAAVEKGDMDKGMEHWDNVKRANKLQKKIKEETLDEGRPKKNPTPETNERDPRKHIQVEAGRAAAGNVIDFEHNNGTKSKITPPMGRRIVAHLQGLKPADRQAAVNKMHDSAEGLKV